MQDIRICNYVVLPGSFICGTPRIVLDFLILYREYYELEILHYMFAA